MEKPSKVLVIEDNHELAEGICRILKLASYEVLYAANGREGLTTIKQELPDIIVCDIIMPHLDGYAVLHILNNDPDCRHIPFIFLTAKTENIDFRNGMNLGADDYLTKPFSGLDLLKIIEIRLKKSKGNGQNYETPRRTEHADLEKLLIQKHLRVFRKKEIIFLEGQSSFEVYYIVSGNIKTFKANFEGKEMITGMYGPGDFLGYIPLLEEKPHHESAEVREDAALSIIPKHDFLELIYNSKALSKKFLKLTAHMLATAKQRLLEIAYQSVRQRVAGALLKISHEYHPEVMITMTRRDISNLIGTTTESLNRTLADFKGEGLIEMSDDGIRILAHQKLEKEYENGTMSHGKAYARWSR